MKPRLTSFLSWTSRNAPVLVGRMYKNVYVTQSQRKSLMIQPKVMWRERQARMKLVAISVANAV